jgi:hypothetical protein
MKTTFSSMEMKSMDRGENRKCANLPKEAMFPFKRYTVDHHFGSEDQALCYMAIMTLYKEGYISDEEFRLIQERTKIFRTHEQMIREEKEQVITEEAKLTVEQRRWIENVRQNIELNPLDSWIERRQEWIQTLETYPENREVKELKLELLKRR